MLHERGGAEFRAELPPRAPARHIEPIFHPQLRRTKDVIRRPDWVKRAGEGAAHRGSLNALTLFGVLFANCVGGGYGFEDGIGSAGPLITLVVCLVLPWLWSLPTGLAVAELSTAVPSNSGVLMWTNAAFPPFISVMCILMTVFITFVGNATYPALTSEYVANLAAINRGEEAAVKIAVIVVCCVLNCVGVEVVGSSSIILCAVTIAPFMILTAVQLFGHGFNRAVLFVNVRTVDWANFFSIISWNYANIENAGAVVEEVANPRRSLPLAMIGLMFGTYLAYVMPMLAGVSAMGVGQDYSQWQAGHWPEVAEKVVGTWLKYLLFAGAMLSGVGFTLTSMCCTSRLLAGIGTMHILPRKVSRIVGYYHPRLGTPIPAIVLNSVVTLVFCVSLDFGNVVSLCQSFYCLRLILIYVGLVKLRVEYPKLARPYALPCNTWLAALSLLPAALFSLFAAIVSAMTSLAIGMALVGFLVVGCALSWLYCHFCARNGFQGVIVECAVSEEDDDEISGDIDPHALSEGVFYNDGQQDQDGDVLLGILPLSSEAAAASATASPPPPPGDIPRHAGEAAMDAAQYTAFEESSPQSPGTTSPIFAGLRRRIGRREGHESDSEEDVEMVVSAPSYTAGRNESALGSPIKIDGSASPRGDAVPPPLALNDDGGSTATPHAATVSSPRLFASESAAATPKDGSPPPPTVDGYATPQV